MKISIIPGLIDNYFFIVHYKDYHIAIDPGDSPPILEFCSANNCRISHIFLTHHHPDHVNGVAGILSSFPKVKVWAPKLHRIELENIASSENTSAIWNWVEGTNQIQIDQMSVSVLSLPGHTKGHVAYYFEKYGKIFLGDVLFGFGCGRIFDGRMEDHFKSMQILKQLPDPTQIYCAHEYTIANIEFTDALLKNPDFSNSNSLGRLKTNDTHYKAICSKIKEARRLNQPSIPLDLATEKQLNLFLLASELSDFQKIREARNQFKSSSF